MKTMTILLAEKTPLQVMADMEADIDNLDTPIGKDILDCLLLKTGQELAEILVGYSLQEFIDDRCERYHEALSEAIQSESFQSGDIGHDGAMEIARAEAFEGLS